MISTLNAKADTYANDWPSKQPIHAFVVDKFSIEIRTLLPFFFFVRLMIEKDERGSNFDDARQMEECKTFNHNSPTM